MLTLIFINSRLNFRISLRQWSWLVTRFLLPNAAHRDKLGSSFCSFRRFREHQRSVFGSSASRNTRWNVRCHFTCRRLRLWHGFGNSIRVRHWKWYISKVWGNDCGNQFICIQFVILYKYSILNFILGLEMYYFKRVLWKIVLLRKNWFPGKRSRWRWVHETTGANCGLCSLLDMPRKSRREIVIFSFYLVCKASGIKSLSIIFFQQFHQLSSSI